MIPIKRRSVLKLGGVAFGSTVAGCLSGGDSDNTTSPTESPTATQTPTPQAECQGSPSNYSWKTSGSWIGNISIKNEDDVSYTVNVKIIHHGSEPCHHSDSTQDCQSPEKDDTTFERTFDLAANETKTYPDIMIEMWESWIDDYTVEVRIEDTESTPQDRVFAYEKAAKDVVGADDYEKVDFYVCDGASVAIDSHISDGTLHTTP